jgi:hypothetical protein
LPWVLKNCQGCVHVEVTFRLFPFLTLQKTVGRSDLLTLVVTREKSKEMRLAPKQTKQSIAPLPSSSPALSCHRLHTSASLPLARRRRTEGRRLTHGGEARAPTTAAQARRGSGLAVERGFHRRRLTPGGGPRPPTTVAHARRRSEASNDGGSRAAVELG